MNVLFLTNELSKTNGWATVGAELVAEWRRHHEVVVLSRKGDHCNDGHDVISCDKYTNPLVLWRDTTRVTRALHGRRFDVVLCNVEPYLRLAALLKIQLRVPALALIGHGTYAYYPFVRGTGASINRWFARRVDRIIVPSRFTSDKVRVWWSGSLDIVHWGVNTTDYHPIDAVKKQNAFLSVGSLKERKGVGTLLRAFAEVVKRYKDTKLYLVGTAADKYVNQTVDLGISQQVIFTGRVSHEDLLRCYSACLCHILLSVNTDSAFEGYGLVHLEANACGIPSIGAAGTANEDVITDGHNGYLCAQQDHHQLAALMVRILADGPTYRQLCTNALRQARERTWSRPANELLALLQQDL